MPTRAALLNVTPPAQPPGPAETGLFDFMDAQHQAIRRELLALQDLVQAIDADGLTPAVRARSGELRNWFDTHAREHHLDEEQHVFPALLANAETADTARRLRQDHGWLEEDWLEIAPALGAAAEGNLWFDLDVLRHAVEVFAQLYTDHMLLEEGLAFPQARERLPAQAQAAMGVEMARRRAWRLAHGGE